jgi:ABC-type dipeptide/oligopeptide/nickel transport system permease component
MENKTIAAPGANLVNDTKPRSDLGLPLIALALVVLSPLSSYLAPYMPWFQSLLLLITIVGPIAGMITGVAALNRGKGRMSKAAKIIAIAAIALPLAFIGLILAFFIGAVTGVISLM